MNTYAKKVFLLSIVLIFQGSTLFAASSEYPRWLTLVDQKLSRLMGNHDTAVARRRQSIGELKALLDRGSNLAACERAKEILAQEEKKMLAQAEKEASALSSASSDSRPAWLRTFATKLYEIMRDQGNNVAERKRLYMEVSKLEEQKKHDLAFTRASEIISNAEREKEKRRVLQVRLNQALRVLHGRKKQEDVVALKAEQGDDNISFDVLHNDIKKLVYINGLGLVNIETYLVSMLTNEKGQDPMNKIVSSEIIHALKDVVDRDFELTPSLYRKRQQELGNFPSDVSLIADLLAAMGIYKEAGRPDFTLPTQMPSIADTFTLENLQLTNYIASRKIREYQAALELHVNPSDTKYYEFYSKLRELSSDAISKKVEGLVKSIK